MTSPHIIAIAALLVVFVVGTVRPVNLGILALVATFAVGPLFFGESTDALYTAFPADLFILLVGVTYLFGVASANGTVERIVNGAARLCGERRGLVPVAIFVVAAVPTALGALGPATVALLAPIALRLAHRYDLDRRMVGLLVVHGSALGNFSPITVLGSVTLQAAERSGLDLSAVALFTANALVNIVLGVVTWLLFGRRHGGEVATATGPSTGVTTGPGGRAGGATGSDEPVPGTGAVATAHAVSTRIRVDQVCTLIGIVLVATLALGFGVDIGIAALVVAAILHLLLPKHTAGAEKGIAWSVVLLVCGIVTYVSALDQFGTIDVLGTSIANIGSPLLTSLLLLFVAALTSAFASSTGILGALIPLAAPLLALDAVNTTGFLIALALSSTLVDATPVSTVGALVVAGTPEDRRQRVYRTLLVWGVSMIVIAPVTTWLVFVAATG